MYQLLDKIKTPADLRTLSIEQLNSLAAEIRTLIKTSVSKNGGHLSSNLGVVELTIALHYVFDFSSDRLIWDVGHQCYVHKILTGRAQGFSNLRKAGGISGFPDPRESVYDQFFVGHAGTSIATAVGLAMGGQLRKTDEKIVAVIGDASIVNGMAFEGLNNTHLVNRQLLIILNDNCMAIDRTQGAFAQYMTKLRVSQPYEDLQRRTKLMVKMVPFLGERINETLDRIKGGIKSTLLGRQVFEQLGIAFYGPIDGHDIANMIKILTALRDVNHPLILQVQTEKGRGFSPAAEDPCAFHSTVPFTIDEGKVNFPEKQGKTFTSSFSYSLENLMKNDDRIVAISAAMPDGTGLAALRKSFPDRVIDIGIAESAAVAIAAGMAKKGLRPIVAIYSTFIQRAFDQIFQEVALQNLPVVFCLDRAGLVGSDGATHHGFCDISLLRPLPNMILMAPADDKELDAALKFALACNQPCVLRYPRDQVPQIEKIVPDYKCEPFAIGKASVLRDGCDAVIFAYGNLVYQALMASDILAGENKHISVISARFAKPLDEKILAEILDDKKDCPLITLEENSLAGGFGSAVLEFARERRLNTNRIISLGLPDKLIDHDTRQNQLQQTGLDYKSIADKIRELINNFLSVH